MITPNQKPYLETLMITPNQKPYLETLFENLNQKSLILENEKKMKLEKTNI